jgi:hypothetical protein
MTAHAHLYCGAIASLARAFALGVVSTGAWREGAYA